MRTTRIATPEQIESSHKWYVIDANGLVLGRLAARVAAILRGKHKPFFTPHQDTGDHVIIVNAERVRFTGRKLQQKQFFHHTGYPGGVRFEALKDMMATRPIEVLERAIRGMLPHNRLGKQLFKKVKIYTGSQHRHAGQKPEVLSIE
ncbi:50S ribosomal protein L13 [candidate division KSB1 bacterium]|nr:50S ribosomal protein L13 [candidate division KSB1 bacterium]